MLLPADDPQAMERAAQRLADGGLVAFPTETVYGLGARADQDVAVARVFEAKGRPSEHPLIVHVTGLDAALAFAAKWPEVAQRLAAAFWPGPLTLIVPRRRERGGAAAGGQGSIGLRSPAHAAARALLEAASRLGVPGVAAPSANRYGRISPTRAEHVVAEFGDDLWVLDGGPCAVGIESTIVDVTRGVPVLLRPGILTREQIEAVAGQPLQSPDHRAPRASGTLEAHYAPRAKVRLMAPGLIETALEVLGDAALKLAVYSTRRPRHLGAGMRHTPMPARAEAVAHELFSVLRTFDDDGAQLIWVEEPPDTSEWEGVADRLRRAAAA